MVASVSRPYLFSIWVLLLTSHAVVAQVPTDDREFDTRLCRCEKPAERWYTSTEDGYYSSWLFPRDQNGFLMIGEVTVLPRPDVLCYGPDSITPRPTTSPTMGIPTSAPQQDSKPTHSHYHYHPTFSKNTYRGYSSSSKKKKPSRKESKGTSRRGSITGKSLPNSQPNLMTAA